MARSVSLSFPWGSSAASTPSVAAAAPARSTEAEASKPLAGMLLAAVMAALLVVADQLIDTLFLLDSFNVRYFLSAVLLSLCTRIFS